MSCSNAFYDHISNCTTALRVNALLTPATPYTWLLTDKFWKEYTGEAIANADGFIDIPLSDLPDGLFTAFSGDFKIELIDGCRKLDFRMAKYYDSIEFHVSPGPREKDFLGCELACETAGGGGNSAVFPFTNLSTLAIAWTTLLKTLYGNTPTAQVYIETTPDHYQLTDVSITMVGGPYDLSEIDVDLGGPASGYLLLS